MRWDGRTPAAPREHLQGGQPLPAWCVIYRRFDGRLVVMPAHDEAQAVADMRSLILAGQVAGIYRRDVSEHGEVRKTAGGSAGYRPLAKPAGNARAVDPSGGAPASEPAPKTAGDVGA